MAPDKPSSEPIAIVGSSCRFAGGVTSPSTLWDLLSNPTDLSKEVPSERFNIEGFYHIDGEYHGTTNARKAYWLEQDHRAFDAGFFNIPPKEAEAVDPQQRMLLEVIYEALERAGYSLDHYAGKSVAVFTGAMTADYDTLSQRDDLTSSQYYATGNARSILSNRISYFFNFKGPSMTIDTACSSSLVALHQAILSLRSGESVMACVAGANLMLTPEQFIVESSLHMLSPTGHCRMWDAEADGYARGEGVAALFIKPLSRALADGDNIEAIIRETGVNSDGKTKGITMPDSGAQADLIRATYRRAGLDAGNPSDRCQYFEAHGTGTPAGDPQEAAAIQREFFGADHSPFEEQDDRKLFVGSVKTVLGHTEGAAGLAGILKVVLGMRNGAIPPNLHLQHLSPSVQPFCSKMEVPITLTPWPSAPTGQPLRGSVNSFGFGGTNAHAILEKYEPWFHDCLANMASPKLSIPQLVQSTLSDRPPVKLPLLFSANSQQSLLSTINAYREYIGAHASLSVEKLAWHLYAHRTPLPYKLTITGGDMPSIVQQMDVLIEECRLDPSKEVCKRSRAPAQRPRILGVFTGQGAQWETMSQGLYMTSSIFRDTIQDLDQILASCADPPRFTLVASINGDFSVHDATVSQPLTTAIQLGLVNVLRHLGIELSVVVGHSSGEIAAAYAAGQLSSRDAILIAHYRGRSSGNANAKRDKKGGMLAAGISRAEADELCEQEDYQGKVFMAAHNSPTSVTLSGDCEVLQTVKDLLVEQGKMAKRLMVDTAYHSPHMEQPAMEYLTAVEACKISPPLPGTWPLWVSSVHGNSEQIKVEELQKTYWKDNMVSPVLFCEAIEHALGLEKFDCAIEIGPQPALRGPVTQTTKATINSELPYSGLFNRTLEDGVAVAEFIGFMWSNFGPAAIDMRKYVQQSSQPTLTASRLYGTPSYPWDYSKIHYRESRISRQYHARTHGPHELLGSRTRDDTPFEMRWRNILKIDNVPWIEGHKFQGQALLPASAYCILALDAARVALGGRSASVIELEGLQFLSGITLEPDSQGVELLFSLSITSSTNEILSPDVIEASFTLTSAVVVSYGASTMRKNFEGRMRIVVGEPTSTTLPGRRGIRAEMLDTEPDSFYQMMSDIGLDYSGPFRAIDKLERRYKFASANLLKRHDEDTTSLIISPATLDSCLQVSYAAFASPGDKSLWAPFLPKAIERIRFDMAHIRPENLNEKIQVDTYLTEYCPASRSSSASITSDVHIFNYKEQMTIQVEGLLVVPFGTARPESDHELYLSTVMDDDPEEMICRPDPCVGMRPDKYLIESCERVASFYVPQNVPQPPHDGNYYFESAFAPSNFFVTRYWKIDTEDTIAAFVKSSPHYPALNLIRQLGTKLPNGLIGMLPSIVREAQEIFDIQKHLCRVIGQIVHRYPRLNILGLPDPEDAMNEHIFRGLGDAFLSYTFAAEPEKNLFDRLPGLKLNKKVVFKKLDFAEDLDDQLQADTTYDMAILSTSYFSIHQNSTSRILRAVKNSMRPGGFLILLHTVKTPLKDRMRRYAADVGDFGFPPTPPEWPDVLAASGFEEFERDPVCHPLRSSTIIVRQAKSPEKELIKSPLSLTSPPKLTDHLLVVGGGSQDNVSAFRRAILSHLSSRYVSITLVESLEQVPTSLARSYTGVILLTDVEEPILLKPSETRLQVLKHLFRPKAVILWATLRALSQNCKQAATFGFLRTLRAETPGIVLHSLDLENLDDYGSRSIAETFVRLTMTSLTHGANEGQFLWSTELETYIQDRRRLIPRVRPWKDGNDRVNAQRRLISNTVNSLEARVSLFCPRPHEKLTEFAARSSPAPEESKTELGPIFLQADYSCVHNFQGQGCVLYVCVGRNVLTGGTVAALSTFNSSYICPLRNCMRLVSERRINLPMLSSLLARLYFCLTIPDSLTGKTVVFVDPDDLLIRCVEHVVSPQGPDCALRTISLRRLRVHPLSTTRDLKQVLSEKVGAVFDFSPESSRVSQMIPSVLHRNCQYHQMRSTATRKTTCLTHSTQHVAPLWNETVKMAMEMVEGVQNESFEIDLISAPDLVKNTESVSAFKLVDWRADRSVPCAVKPIVEANLFSPYKTYLLVGLTRDFGQSLCRLFAEHGARHIVVASRNPNKLPTWQTELGKQGINIKTMQADITNMDSVRKLADDLDMCMPPVGGVVNGAMVLDDRVFSEMDEHTFERVMLPKTVGSNHLQAIFDDPDLEFFIMTSSFAAIGGHAGQSNYAAANMYMNGLAASRRRQGLVGSVLNIGVIYGLGLLAREKRETYAGLEREGYPPISERDLHHMFLEAIVAGRPDDEQIRDITTGLRRFRANDPNPQHWHTDPRFSHFYVHDDDDGGLSVEQDSREKSVQELLSAATTVEQVTEVLVSQLTYKLQTLLQLGVGSVDVHRGFSDLGIDSLLAVDIRTFFFRMVGKDVPVMKILGSASIYNLCSEIAEKIVAETERESK